MSVVSFDRYRASDAAAHYESRQAEAAEYAAALESTELKQRASLLIAMSGQRAPLMTVQGVGSTARVVATPLPDVLSLCLDHHAVMAALMDCLANEGGERWATLRKAFAEAFANDTAKDITDIERGAV